MSEQPSGGTRSAGSGGTSSGGGGGKELVTPQGKTSIADGVVQKIAGIAARDVKGVHNLGTGGARTLGSLRERMPGTSSQPSITQGIAVEVGERQAAVDCDIVVEYGASIIDVATAVRRNIITTVERTTGLEVTEVNVFVDDIFLQGEPEEEPPPARVQ